MQPQPSSPSSTWLARINSIQSTRSSPSRAFTLARAENFRETLALAIESNVYQSRSNQTYSSFTAGLRGVSAPGRGLTGASAEALVMRSARNRSEAAAATSSRPFIRIASPSLSADIDNALDPETVAEVDHAITALESGIVAVSEAADGSKTLDQLLIQLKVEPINDSESYTKFLLFDEYLSTVVLLRDQVHSLFARGLPALSAAGAAASGLSRRLKSIDAMENLAVEEPPRGEWLVYGMARRAAKNHSALSSALRELETKLALVAREDLECPFCFEVCVSPKILSCCHKACTECWTHWVNVRAEQHDGPPFCPYCHNVEFIERINTYAAYAASAASVRRD
jgi:hypothetical protein